MSTDSSSGSGPESSSGSSDEPSPGPSGRRETDAERADRNWNDLLQELRVSQTGAQLIAGFLLTLPFQDRFKELDNFQVTVYLCLVVLATSTIVLTLTPVAMHRHLFGRQAKHDLVRAAHRSTQAVLSAISLLVTGILLLVFDVVLSRPAALVTAGCALVATVLLLAVLPRVVRRRAEA